MGVRGLDSFVRQSVPGGVKRINIKREIEKFKNDSRIANPAIVIDLNGITHLLGTSDVTICGGRYNAHLQTIERFFNILKSYDVKIVLFLDGRLQEEKVNTWCTRRDDDYMAYEYVSQGRYSSKIPGGRSMKSAENINRFASQWNVELFTATDYDCDAGIAQYATQINALCVIADDSDFLIFDGNWQYWNCRDIDFQNMKIDRFSRQKLRDHFNLSALEMRVFACILGTDFFKDIELKKDFGRPKFVRLNNIAKYIRSFQINESNLNDLLPTICKELYFQSNAAKLMLENVQSYERHINFAMDDMMKYSSQSDLMNAVLYNGIFHLDAVLTDFSISDNFMTGAMSVIQRNAGILLKSQELGNRNFKMVTKTSASNYSMKLLVPISPEYIIPPLRELIFDTNNEHIDIKWKSLLWSLSLQDFDETQLREIAENSVSYFVIVLGLAFLLEKELISVREADLILLSEHETRHDSYDLMKERKPFKYNIRGVRIAHMYNKIIFLVWDCLYICGLEKYITPCLFDGYHFQNLFEKYAGSSNLMPLLMEIKNLRIYEYLSLNEIANLKI